MRQVGGMEMQYSQDPHTWVGNPQMGKISQSLRSSTWSRGPKHHTGLPSPKVVHLLHQENEPPEHLALKTSRAYVWESQGAVGNTDSALKSVHKISHAPSPSTESVVWKEPGSDPLADLGEPPGEERGNWNSPLGKETLVAAILGSSFFRNNTAAGKCHFVTLHLVY